MAPRKRTAADLTGIRQRGARFQVRIFGGIDPETGKQLILTGSAASEAEAIALRDGFRKQIEDHTAVRTDVTLRVLPPARSVVDLPVPCDAQQRPLDGRAVGGWRSMTLSGFAGVTVALHKCELVEEAFDALIRLDIDPPQRCEVDHRLRDIGV
jgi:hypothetical protein